MYVNLDPIKGINPFIRKVVFELKYEQGFTYLDKCGRIINTIQQERPEWILGGTNPNPQNTSLVNVNDSCRFNFSFSKLDLAIEQELGGTKLTEDQISGFSNHVGYLSEVIIDQLGLKTFNRIGSRVWYIFPTNSNKHSETWLRELGCYTVSEEFIDVFKGSKGNIKATNFVVIISSDDRNFRISFNSIERNIQLDIGEGILSIPSHSLPKGQREHLQEQFKVKRKHDENPEYAAIIDIDVFQEDPMIVKPKEFVDENIIQGFNRLRSVFLHR